jgi:hypothetical protein
LNFKLLTCPKWVALGAIAMSAVSCIPLAQAAGNWSIGLTVPGVVVSEPPPGYYGQAPLYAPPAPVYYEPAAQGYYSPPPPVFYRPPPPPVYYRPAPAYYAPPPPVYYREGERRHHGRHHDHRGEDRDD